MLRRPAPIGGGRRREFARRCWTGTRTCCLQRGAVRCRVAAAGQDGQDVGDMDGPCMPAREASRGCSWGILGETTYEVPAGLSAVSTELLLQSHGRGSRQIDRLPVIFMTLTVVGERRQTSRPTARRQALCTRARLQRQICTGRATT